MAVDMINRPPHYTFGTVEVIDFIDSTGEGYGFSMGNAIKYIARADHKGTRLEDLKKARFYVQHIIDLFAANKSWHAEKNSVFIPSDVSADWKLPKNLRSALIHIACGGRMNLEAAIEDLTKEIEEAEK